MKEVVVLPISPDEASQRRLPSMLLLPPSEESTSSDRRLLPPFTELSLAPISEA